MDGRSVRLWKWRSSSTRDVIELLSYSQINKPRKLGFLYTAQSTSWTVFAGWWYEQAIRPSFELKPVNLKDTLIFMYLAKTWKNHTVYTHSIFSKYLAPCLFQNISQLVSGHFLVLWIICRVEKTSQKCTQKRGFCSTLGSYNCNIFYGHLLDYWYPYLPCCISGQDLICYLQSVLHLAKASPVDVNMIASVCKFLTAYIHNCTLCTVD